MKRTHTIKYLELDEFRYIENDKVKIRPGYPNDTCTWDEMWNTVRSDIEKCRDYEIISNHFEEINKSFIETFANLKLFFTEYDDATKEVIDTVFRIGELKVIDPSRCVFSGDINTNNDFQESGLIEYNFDSHMYYRVTLNNCTLKTTKISSLILNSIEDGEQITAFLKEKINGNER